MVKKCPNCAEPISGLVNVCPSCNYVISNNKYDDSLNLNEIVFEIEENFKKLKTVPLPSIIKTVNNNIQYYILGISIIILMLGIKYVNISLGIWLIVIASLFIFYGSLTFLDVFDKKAKEKKDPTFDEVKASFEKQTRLVNIFFGEDRKVKALLNELKSEISIVEQRRKHQNKINLIICIIIGILVSIPFLLPSPISIEERVAQIEKKKLADLKTSEIYLNGNNSKTSGNLGSCYKVSSSESKIIIDFNLPHDNIDLQNGYSISIQGIKLKLKNSEKQKLKKEIKKIKKNCDKGFFSGRCWDIKADIIFEDENNNSIGFNDLDNNSDLESLFFSESEEVLISFNGYGFSKEDIEKLSKAKNFTISVIAIKID